MEPSFQNIPDNLYVPGFFVEFSTLVDEIPTDDVEPVLLYVPMISTGTATPDEPTRVLTPEHGRGLVGRGSIGDRMITAFRANNPLKELWIIPVADDGSAVKPIWTFFVSEPPTQAGSIFLYIGGQRVQIAVNASDTEQQVAAAIVAKLESSPDLLVEYVANSLKTPDAVTFTTTTASDLINHTAHGLTAGTRIRFIEGTGTLPPELDEGVDYYVRSTGLVADSFTISEVPGTDGTQRTFTTDASGAVKYYVVPTFTVRGRNGGMLLNDLDIQLNYRSAAAGEKLPAGLEVTWSRTTNGATDPDLTNALAALTATDEGYDYIGTPWLSQIDDLKTEVDARWAWDKLVFGHVFAVKRETAANLITYGEERNSAHETIFGIENYPTPEFEILGAAMGQLSLTLDDDPAVPEQTLVLNGVLPPKRGNTGRWGITTRNSVLAAGIATLLPGRSNTVALERARTTYKTDADGNTDKTYRDIAVPFIEMRSTRYLGRVVKSKLRRKKYVPVDSVLPKDSRTVNDTVIFNEFLAAYNDLVEVGWLTNNNTFKERASVGQDSNDPSRINVLFANKLVDQVRIVALMNQQVR